MCSPCLAFCFSKAQVCCGHPCFGQASFLHFTACSALCSDRHGGYPPFTFRVRELSSSGESPLLWAQTIVSRAWEWGPLTGSLENVGV